MHFLPANRLRVYRNFKAIEKDDFHGIVLFYETHEDALQYLETETLFECMLAYANALLELNQFGKHVVMCDQCLLLMIENNLGQSGNDPLYRQILFDKSISLFYLDEFDQAMHITKQLMRLDPSEPAFFRLHVKCALQQKPQWLMRGRALSMALILLSAALIGVYLFVCKPYRPAWSGLVLGAHYTTLGASVLLLLWIEARHIYITQKQARR